MCWESDLDVYHEGALDNPQGKGIREVKKITYPSQLGVKEKL